jgi:hypothetical protein
MCGPEQDKQLLEKVQQKAVNWVTGLAGETYEEKCKELGLSTLENRCWEQDMVQPSKKSETSSSQSFSQEWMIGTQFGREWLRDIRFKI